MEKYSQSQISNLKSKIIRKVITEIDLAFKNDSVTDLLEKYGVELEEKQYFASVTRRSKILVLGQLSGRSKDYQLSAKKLGINKDNIEFMDYNDAKHFNAEKLQWSNTYSDIICGPIPHKIEGMGDASSLITKIEQNPESYPKLIKAVANDKLKITISGFKNYIMKTRFFDEVVSNNL